MNDIDIDYLADIWRHQVPIDPASYSDALATLNWQRSAAGEHAPMGLVVYVVKPSPLLAIAVHTLWSPARIVMGGERAMLASQYLGTGGLRWAAAAVSAYDNWATTRSELESLTSYSTSLRSEKWGDLPLHEQLAIRTRSSVLPLEMKSGVYLSTHPHDLRVFTHGGQSFALTMAQIAEVTYAGGVR